MASVQWHGFHSCRTWLPYMVTMFFKICIPWGAMSEGVHHNMHVYTCVHWVMRIIRQNCALYKLAS